MGLFDPFQGEDLSSQFLKGSDFEEGLKLEIVSVEKIKASKSKYGANELDYLYKSKILEKGETFRYTFLLNGEEKIFDSKSAVFFIAFKNVNPETGDKVHIQREGEGIDTRYEISIV